MPILRLLIGFKQATFTLLNYTFGTISRPKSPPVWCILAIMLLLQCAPCSVLQTPLPTLKQVPEAWTPPRHPEILFIPLETDTPPLPKTTTKPALTSVVPPSVLHVTLFASVLLLTMEIMAPAPFRTLSVCISFSLVETEAEERFALKSL